MPITPGQVRQERPAQPVIDLQRSLESHFLSRLEYLNAIGIALSQESDLDKLLETILIAAKNAVRKSWKPPAP